MKNQTRESVKRIVLMSSFGTLLVMAITVASALR